MACTCACFPCFHRNALREGVGGWRRAHSPLLSLPEWQIPVQRGLEFMTELYLLLEQGAAPGQRQEMSRYAQWFNNPPYAVPDPMVACATGALGPVSPRVEGEFDA